MLTRPHGTMEAANRCRFLRIAGSRGYECCLLPVVGRIREGFLNGACHASEAGAGATRANVASGVHETVTRQDSAVSEAAALPSRVAGGIPQDDGRPAGSIVQTDSPQRAEAHSNAKVSADAAGAGTELVGKPSWDDATWREVVMRELLQNGHSRVLLPLLPPSHPPTSAPPLLSPSAPAARQVSQRAGLRWLKSGVLSIRAEAAVPPSARVRARAHARARAFDASPPRRHGP